MTNEFDKQRHRKAFIYTAAICSLLLLGFIFISWTVKPPALTVVNDRIEINFGDNNEGFGEEEPLAKGEPAPEVEKTAPTPQEEAADKASEENIEPEDNAEEVAAPVVKPIAKVVPKPTPIITKPVVKPIVKTTPSVMPSTAPVTKAAPAPKPKFTMPGAKGPGGNNATKNNDTYQQGNNKNGNGNKGVPTGNPDTYGTKPGGSISPATVTKGSRKIISVRPYKFPGDLEKATIFADIKVSPDGSGTFLRIAQGSTSSSAAYASAIRGYLQNIKFDAADDDGVVTVRFNFNVD
jgi:outer membrane biosynthesis protein TonB